MEDGLVHLQVRGENFELVRLNPYCDGRWSRT